MRFFEICLSTLTFLTLLQCFYFIGYKPARLLSLLPIGLGLVFILHIVIEKMRWQMAPTYGAAGFVLAWSIAQFFTQPGIHSKLRKALDVLVGAIMVLVAFVLLLSSTAASIAMPVFEIPSPGGPYMIGTQDMDLVDTSRPEWFTTDPNDHRELLVRVWYPADPSSVNTSIQPYWPEVKHGGRLLLKQLEYPTFLLDYMALVPSHSHINAPVATADSKFPVIVFSHGYTDDLSGQLTLMEELASQGYVIFSISHPYEALITEFPDGRVILADPRVFAAPTQPQNRQLNLDDQFDVWVRDTIFVLDKIEEMNLETSSSIFSGKLDLQRIGLAGYSFGGATAAEVCFLDNRCRAGANMDGSQFGQMEDPSNHLSVPFMFLYSENNAGMNDRIYFNVENWAYRVTVQGTRHFNFTDKVLWSPYLYRADEYLPYGIGPINAQRIIDIKRAYLLSFFNRHLKGDVAFLLDGSSPMFPDVDFQYQEPMQ